MQSAVETSSCLHCSEPLTPNQNGFCCLGCEAVYRVLKAKGLNTFYELSSQKISAETLRPSSVFSFVGDPKRFDAWKTESFFTQYVEKNQFRVYLEGVHCLGCLWLVENIPNVVPGVEKARLDLGKNTATFFVADAQSLHALGLELASYGYRPHPLAKDASQKDISQSLHRRELIRVAVAALASSNIMLSSIPLYAGVDAKLSQLFTGLSAFLYLFVLCFSATPFYLSSLQSLKLKKLSIDLPITVAIVGGGILSYWNWIGGSDKIYFDSLATIVFLLLLIRLALKQIQSRSLVPPGFSLGSETITAFVDGNAVRVPAHSVRLGSVVEIDTQTTLPVDGILKSETADIDCSIISGEPLPVSLKAGQMVYAGSILRSKAVLVEVTAAGMATKLGQILQQAQAASLRPGRLGKMSGQVGSAFVVGVFIVMAIVAITSDLTATELVRRLLAICVVSCPCAFAFAVPLAHSLAVRKLALKGISARNIDALEKLAKANHIFLDKTGTITEGFPSVTEWTGSTAHSDISSIYSIEKKSRHPVAIAIVSYLKEKFPNIQEQPVDSFLETPGTGVEGTIDGAIYAIRKASLLESTSATQIEVYSGKSNDLLKRIAGIHLRDSVRKDSPTAVAELKSLGLTPWILSGDNAFTVNDVANQSGIPLTNALSGKRPEDKASVIKQNPRSIMVGDGANDALAFAEADAGIAVSGGAEWSLKTSDLFLSAPGIRPMVHLIRFSRRMRNVIVTNLVVSTLFNSFAITMAAMGLLSPLFAALFMPVSSLSVLLITLIGMRRIAW